MNTRLTIDALTILSQLGPGETVTIDHIATNLFGKHTENGRKKTPVSKARAISAARSLSAGRKVKLAMEGKDILSMTALHKDGGLQAQSLMNLVCRAGADRRKMDGGLPEGVEEDRRVGERRSGERNATS